MGVFLVHRQADFRKALFFGLFFHQIKHGTDNALMAILCQQIHLAQVHFLLALVMRCKSHKPGIFPIQICQIVPVILVGHLVLHRVVRLEFIDHIVGLPFRKNGIKGLMPHLRRDVTQDVYLLLGFHTFQLNVFHSAILPFIT